MIVLAILRPLDYGQLSFFFSFKFAHSAMSALLDLVWVLVDKDFCMLKLHIILFVFHFTFSFRGFYDFYGHVGTLDAHPKGQRLIYHKTMLGI